MVKEIRLYTNKDYLEREVIERLKGTDIAVVIDHTNLGRFLDPSFTDHNGNRYVGNGPLYEFIDKIKSGEENPVLDNPLGRAMEKVKSFERVNPAFKNQELFGDYFS
ncbi:hypothetical protein J4437_05880 [Candidatus Woesearchaeota archaeon]|nr:hypothetical protein [Candidatus Woesearchaeota archaeon]